MDTLLRALIVLAALAALVGATAWIFARLAPEGYEDERGFHYGRDSRKDGES